MDEPKVKEKYKLVAKFYCGEACGNAERACIMAGYSRKYARGNAYKVVANSGVQRYIKYLNETINKQHIASIEDIQGYWSNVMFSKTEETKDKLRASELLGKTKGMFNSDW